MPSEYDALLDAQPAQQKSEYDALLEQPKQEGGVLSGIAAGIGRALNPINLIKGALDIGGESDISKISRYSHSLADIVSGKPVQESLEKNIPEVAQQRAALTGKLGGREQAAEITGLGLQAGLLALPFAHGKLATLRETAFGKTEAPLASETAAAEEIQKGGPSATEPNRETGALPTEQGKPTQQETAVQPETRDTRETPAEAPAQEVGFRPHETIASAAYELPSGEILDTGRFHDPLAVPEGKLDYSEPGFLTNTGRFVTRDEAAKIAGFKESVTAEELHRLPEGTHPIQEEERAPVSEPTETTTDQSLTKEEGGASEKVQVQGEDEGERKKGVLTPEAATVQPPAAPSPQPKVGGVHAAALAERPIETPEPAEVITREEGIRLGNVWLDKGGDPQKIINQFNKTGEVGPTNMGRMTATLLRKQAATDFARDALRENPSDPALQAKVEAATADEQAFSNAYKPMHSVASASLSSLKGTQPLTEEMAQSYSGLERSYQEQTGKTFTPEQSQRAAKLSKQSQELNQQFKSDNEEVFKAADKAYKDVPTVRKVKTLDDLVAVLSQPMKEVC